MPEAAEARRSAARDALGLAAILALAAVVRGIAWSRTAVLFNDGPVFLGIARAIGEGRWAEALAHPYHPLYPASVAAVASLPIPLGLERAAVVVSILGGLLTIAALFVLAREQLGREVAWGVAWVAALHPWAVDFSSDVMSDGLYMGAFAWGLVGLGRIASRPGGAGVVLVALAGALAYWTRPEGAGLWVAGAWVLAWVAAREPARRRAALGGLATLGLLAVLLATPYVAGVASVTGELALTQKKSVAGWLAGETGTAPDRSALAEDVEALPLPEVAVRSDGRGTKLPERDLAGALSAVGRVLATALSTLRFELIPFVWVGAWALRERDDRARILATIGAPLLLYGAALTLLVWSEGYVSRRHALPPLLPLLALAVLGARSLLGALTARGRRAARWATAYGLTGLLVAVLLLGWGPRDLRARRTDRAAVREAAEWLAEAHPGSGPVAAQKLRTAYYARADFVPLMPGRDHSQRRYLRGRGARWVVIDDAKLTDHQGLEAGIGDWLEPVHAVVDGAQRVVVLRVGPVEAAR